MTNKKTPKILKARVTHLEMTNRLHKHVPPPVNVRLAIMRAYDMPLHFYRYLYALIGSKHHWFVRRKMSDKHLSAIIHSENTLIHILYIDGCPAGFAETTIEDCPKHAEIVYFGVVPDYQGRGLSQFFFNEVVSAAWNSEPEKIIIQTNTLDSPRALQLYQKCGFKPVSFSDAEIEEWQ